MESGLQQSDNLPTQTGATLSSWIQTVAGAAVGIVFCLYTVGFVIVNSFLARFGVRAGAVFTFDYVAAALCYFVFVAAVAAPIWVIYHALTKPDTDKADLSKRMWATLAIWNALIYIFRPLYFPDSPASKWSWVNTTWAIILGLHLLLLLLISRLLPKTERPEVIEARNKLKDFLKHRLFVVGYITSLSFIFLLQEPNLDGLFVFTAASLYAGAMFLMGTGISVWDLKEHLKRREIQLLWAVSLICLILANASTFGKRQYPLLPTIVGGGRPSTITIKMADYRSLGDSLLPITNGLIGPVLLLYQSDSEICVITKSTFAKGLGSAVQLKRDLVDWLATESSNTSRIYTPLAIVVDTPTPKPTPTFTPTATPTPTLTPTATATLTPTPTPTLTAIATSTGAAIFTPKPTPISTDKPTPAIQASVVPARPAVSVSPTQPPKE
jgi:hypothetical protein